MRSSGFRIMTALRISLAVGLLSTSSIIGNAPGLAQSANVQHMRYGFAFNAITPVIINVIVAEQLGYFRQEGLAVEPLPLGSLAAVAAQLAAGRLEFGAGSAEFALMMIAKGERVDQVAFFETAYPFKWDIAVRPDSSMTSVADLRSARMGVASFGISDFEVGKALLRLEGIDPDKDVTWTAVGAGVTAGHALERGAIDALVYFDTGFGQIEAAGIPIRYLPRPKAKPNVGGIFMWTTPTMLTHRRAQVAGFGRATAKAQLFILENPRAAAELFLKAYPEAAPKGRSREEQIKAIMVPIARRMPLFRHYDRAITAWGFISPSEIDDEARFLNLAGKISDPMRYFNNELSAEINRFDELEVHRQAQQFSLHAAGK